MKLYMDFRWLSPYTYSIFVALKEKGIPFELEEVSFEKGRSLPGAFQDRTFTDLIPALEDGKLVLSESMAILEYLEEKGAQAGKPSLYPPAIEDRARARMLLSWYRCGMQALRNERSSETVFYLPEQRATAPLSADAREEVAELARFLKTLLKPGAKALLGEWSIVDAETALMLHRLIANGDELDADLVAYARAQWQRPSVQEFVRKQRPPYASYYR